VPSSPKFGNTSCYIRVIKIFGKLEKIREKLKKNNTEFIIVLAPGKGHYYPEYIPDYMNRPKQKSNYDLYKELLEKSDIPTFDVNNWFLKMKDTIQYPLFPKTGTHWSDYGATLVADSLIYFVEDLMGYKMAHFSWEEIELSDKPRNADNDLEKTMNLFTEIPQIVHAYPIPVKDDNTNNITKPSVIGIGDSFFWHLFHWPFAWSIGEFKYYYYFNSIFPDNYSKKTTVYDIDLTDQLFSSNLLILLTSTANLNNIGYGFIDYTYPLLLPENFTSKKLLIEKYTNRIINNQDLMKMIREKAIVKNISVDSMIYLDANYLAEKELLKKEKAE